MGKKVKLYAVGRKDGIRREVTHIPIHGGTHQTRIENREKQFRGFKMNLKLGGGHGTVVQVIHEDHILEVKE